MCSSICFAKDANWVYVGDKSYEFYGDHWTVSFSLDTNSVCELQDGNKKIAKAVIKQINPAVKNSPYTLAYQKIDLDTKTRTEYHTESFTHDGILTDTTNFINDYKYNQNDIITNAILKEVDKK